jgi:LDH2 family malate/lactate/ureidoglycolate dehydrogenase
MNMSRPASHSSTSLTRTTAPEASRYRVFATRPAVARCNATASMASMASCTASSQAAAKAGSLPLALYAVVRSTPALLVAYATIGTFRNSARNTGFQSFLRKGVERVERAIGHVRRFARLQ